MSGYTPYRTHVLNSSPGPLQKAWNNIEWGVSRPAEIFQGQFDPRPGLSRSQNMFLDFSGVSDRSYLDPKTRVGAEYWKDEFTKARPKYDKFRDSTAWKVFATAVGIKPVVDTLFLNHEVRESADQIATDAVTDPLRGAAFKLGKFIPAAFRVRMRGVHPMDFPLTVRYARSTKLTPYTHDMKGKAELTPYLRSPNHYMTELLHTKLYSPYRSHPDTERRNELVASPRNRQFLTGYAPGDVMDHPQRMDLESYIHWLRTPANPRHKKAIEDLYVEWFGDYGKYWEGNPTSPATLIRPDERANPLEGPAVPRRKDAVDPLPAGAKAEAGPLPGLAEPGPRTKYDNVVAMHSQLAGSQAESNRMASAAAARYYTDQYREDQTKRLFQVLRMQDTQLQNQALDELRQDSNFRELMAEFDADESLGTKQLKQGLLPNQIDMDDFDSSALLFGQPKGGRSRYLRKILDGDVGELPWALKPAGWRRMGYMEASDGPSAGPEYSYLKYRDQYLADTGQFGRSVDIQTDLGAMFDSMLQNGGIPMDHAGLVEYIEKNPRMRDMFFNPYDLGIHNVLHYATRVEPGFLAELERVRFRNMERAPKHARFTQSYPLMRTPDDVILGPQMHWNEEEVYLETRVQNPQTHVEMRRAMAGLFGQDTESDYNKILSRSVGDYLHELGWNRLDEPVYDPYRNVAYSKDLVVQAAKDMMQPFWDAIPEGFVDLGRKDELEHILRSAEAHITNQYLGEMVGLNKSTRGTEVMMERLFKEDSTTTPNIFDSNYDLSAHYQEAETTMLEALKAMPEFANVEDPMSLSRWMNGTLITTKKKTDMGEGVIERFRQGLPANVNEELYNTKLTKRAVEAGTVVMHMSPVMFRHPSDVYGFQAAAMTPGTATLMNRNIDVIAGEYGRGLSANPFTEQGIMREEGAGRNLFTAPIYFSDLSMTNLIKQTGHDIFKYSPSMSHFSWDMEPPELLRDELAAKFFNPTTRTPDAIHTKLNHEVITSLRHANYEMTAATSLEAQDDLLEHMDSFLWPEDLMTFKLELPEGYNRWNPEAILGAYQNAVRTKVLETPQLLEVPLMAAYDNILSAAKQGDPYNSVKVLDNVFSNIIENILPVYENVTGQDAMVRGQLATVMHGISQLDEYEISQALPEIVRDAKGIVLHMQGNFGAYHGGMAWQTALRGIKFEPSERHEIETYVQGYTNEIMNLSELVVGSMEESVEQLIARAKSGQPISAGWLYNVKTEDVNNLIGQAGLVDRPIRMDPMHMSLASDIGGLIQPLHEQLLELQKSPKTILDPGVVEHLRFSLQNIQQARNKFQGAVQEHYFESLMNIAEDPNIDAAEVGTYFRAQSSAMNSLMDNPAALALAKSWEAGDGSFDPLKAKARITSMRAAGILTEREGKTLEMLASLQSVDRKDLVNTYYEIYGAHKPNLPKHVQDLAIARKISKYGPEMQQLMTYMKEEPEFADLLVAKLVNESEGNFLATAHRMADLFDMELLDQSMVWFGEYPEASRRLVQLMAARSRNYLRGK